MIRPVSAAQYADALARRTPLPEEVRPGVWSVPLRLPSWAGMESTLTTAYLGPNGRVGLIDPGWDTPDNRALLTGWLRMRGRSIHDVEVVASSHLHADHLGLGQWLHDTAGTRLAVHSADVEALLRPAARPEDDELYDRWGVPLDLRESLGTSVHTTFPALDEGAVDAVEDGAVLDVAGTALRVLHTPGHTSGSVCFVDERHGLIHTGDHVLPLVRPGLAMGGDHPSDPIGDYLSSLGLLRPHVEKEVLPGHEFRFHGLADRLDQLEAHHRRRSAEVDELIDELERPTIWRVAQRLSWTGGWAGIPARMRRSALRQTEFHARYLGRGADIVPGGAERR